MIPEIATNLRAELGEGPSWDAEKEILYWVDITRGVIYAHTPNDPNDEVIAWADNVSCVVPRKSGGLALTLQYGYYGLDLETKELTPLTEQVERESDGNRFNDGKCDPAGRFWAGTMDGHERSPSGSLYVLEKNQKLKKVLPNVTISNGLGWSPDNRVMYYIDTPTMKVSAFDYSVETGAIENRRTAVDFAQNNQPGSPDGMAVDEEGMIWVAHWGGARLTRWNPSTGKLLETLQVPADQVTSCCFGGKNLDELYITSATNGLDPQVLAAKPMSGGLFVAKVDVKGLPTNEFTG